MQRQGEQVKPCFVSFASLMRKFAAISLLIVFAYTSLVPMKVQEAVRALPNLLEHFEEHLEENPQLTLMEFWELHYGSEYNEHKSDHDHSKLPCKDHNCCHVHSMVLAVVVENQFPLQVPSDASGAIHHIDEEMLPSSLVHNIWQPPKSC